MCPLCPVTSRVPIHRPTLYIDCPVTSSNLYVKNLVTPTNVITKTVYSIPLSYNKVYIGETGRCLKVRMPEHRNAVRNAEAQGVELLNTA